jgi:hypothetical protein
MTQAMTELGSYITSKNEMANMGYIPSDDTESVAFLHFATPKEERHQTTKDALTFNMTLLKARCLVIVNKLLPKCVAKENDGVNLLDGYDKATHFINILPFCFQFNKNMKRDKEIGVLVKHFLEKFDIDKSVMYLPCICNLLFVALCFQKLNAWPLPIAAFMKRFVEIFNIDPRVFDYSKQSKLVHLTYHFPHPEAIVRKGWMTMNKSETLKNHDRNLVHWISLNSKIDLPQDASVTLFSIPRKGLEMSIEEMDDNGLSICAKQIGQKVGKIGEKKNNVTQRI